MAAYAANPFANRVYDVVSFRRVNDGRQTAFDRRQLAVAAVLGLVLIASALRFYRIAAQDIWGDEAFSISLSLKPLSYVVAGAADTHPPFYPLVLYSWLKIVGIPIASAGALTTRALSALVGILAVPLTYVVARRAAPARPRVAWFSAVLAAVSPLLVYYSQETRMYELATVLALGSAYFALSPSLGKKDAAGYLVFALLAVYTHYSAFFLIAAENVYMVLVWWRNSRHMRRWALLQAAVVLAYLPWIAVQTSFLSGKASARFDEWSWRGIEMVFGKTFLAFGMGLTADWPWLHIGAALFLAVAILGIVSILIPGHRDHPVLGQATPGGSLAEHAARTDLRPWMAPLCFTVPVVIAWLVDPVMPFFFERYVLVALPGFCITAGLGLDFIARRRSLVAVLALSVLVLFNGWSLWNYYWNDSYAKGKYGQMMAYVASQMRPGDALILNNPLQKPLYDYYQPHGLPAIYLPDGAPLEDPQTRRQLSDYGMGHSRLWLVMFGNPAEYDPTGYLQRWLGAHAFKTLSRGYVDASLALYVMPSGSAAIHGTVTAMLGDSISFAGYDLDRDELAPGETLQLVLHWQCRAPVGSSYKVFAHLVGAMNPETQSPVWAQMDGEPVGGSRPTATWQAGEAIDDLYGLQLPGNTPPGDYTLEVGMYDPATSGRVAVWDADGKRVADDRVILGQVRVRAK